MSYPIFNFGQKQARDQSMNDSAWRCVEAPFLFSMVRRTEFSCCWIKARGRPNLARLSSVSWLSTAVMPTLGKGLASHLQKQPQFLRGEDEHWPSQGCKVQTEPEIVSARMDSIYPKTRKNPFIFKKELSANRQPQHAGNSSLLRPWYHLFLSLMEFTSPWRVWAMRHTCIINECLKLSTLQTFYHNIDWIIYTFFFYKNIRACFSSKIKIF